MKPKRNPIYQRILDEIGKEIHIHPNYADLQNQFALLLMVEGEMEKAEVHFLKALRLNQKYREAILNLAFLYMEMRRWKRAEKILLPEVKRNPRDGFLHHVLGILYLQTGRQKEATAWIRKAIQYYSHCQDYYKKKGMWQRGTIHLDQKAEKALKKIHLGPYAQFHNFIGLNLAKKGKFVQAIKELKKAERLKPNEFIFHANLGTVYYYQGAYSKAIQEFQKALKIDPFYGMGYANLSYIYGLMSRTQEALRYMEKAVQLNPRYADLHYNLALLYNDRNQYKKAVSELKKALRINPNYLFARINLGVLYEDQKKWKEARREYRKILRITPNDEHVQKRLKRIS
jgi:tetratricopeptide (TPR) repeat protein